MAYDAAQHAKRMQQYSNLVIQARNLFETRNKEYGDSIRYGGSIGAIMEMVAVVGRLQQVALTPEGRALGLPRQYEIMRDKFVDAINYAVIGLMLLEEGNLLGEPLESREEAKQLSTLYGDLLRHYGTNE